MVPSRINAAGLSHRPVGSCTGPRSRLAAAARHDAGTVLQIASTSTTTPRTIGWHASGCPYRPLRHARRLEPAESLAAVRVTDSQTADRNSKRN